MTKIVNLGFLSAILAATQSIDLVAMNIDKPNKDLTILLEKALFSITLKKNALFAIINHETWNETKKIEALKKLFEMAMDTPDVNAHCAGLPALHYAIGRGHLEIVKFLIESGANINESCDVMAYTPLHWAILKGEVAIAKFLIKKGAELENKSSEGVTVLILAAQSGYPEIVEILIDNKVDTNIRDLNKNTALHPAAAFGNKKALELLIQAGVAHNVKNIAGGTALNVATVGLNCLDLAKKLRALHQSVGDKFYEDENDKLKPIDTVLTEKFSACIAYLKLVEDFHSYLKIMREGAQMFGKCFKNQFITETFASFANTYFTGENGGQNFTDVQKLLQLDKDKYFTKSFNTWRKNNTVFGASAGSTITAQPTALTPNGLTNTNLCATMGNLSITKK